jgi:hypothetical protein
MLVNAKPKTATLFEAENALHRLELSPLICHHDFRATAPDPHLYRTCNGSPQEPKPATARGFCRKPYVSNISDEEWLLVAPYLLLQREGAGQREHALREVFNGLRYIVKTGAPWQWMPNDLPPWAAVYQQTRRWLAAGCFKALVDDLRAML